MCVLARCCHYSTAPALGSLPSTTCRTSTSSHCLPRLPCPTAGTCSITQPSPLVKASLTSLLCMRNRPSLRGRACALRPALVMPMWRASHQ